jgi:hypothetical protein
VRVDQCRKKPLALAVYSWLRMAAALHGQLSGRGAQSADSVLTCAHAQVPRRMIGTDAFQETPIVEVTRQITKHNYLVMDVRDLPRVVKEARAPASVSHEKPPLGKKGLVVLSASVSAVSEVSAQPPGASPCKRPHSAACERQHSVCRCQRSLRRRIPPREKA